MSSPASPSAGSPRRLGRYTILEALAKGGMAQVFIAQKDNAPEISVLKQLLGELETHATAGKRFYREAHVASYLQHPRIARTIDAGFEDGAFCIAMEFIAGRDVESLMHLLMRQGRMLPYELSLAVAVGVLEGLEYAHDALDPSGAPLDLVHRDLSPRNVMLSYEGDVKIIDFGLARGSVDDFKTAPGMILGTLRYVSPEQAVADPIDRRSDLYSISVVLYEMLSGRPLVRDGKALDVLTDVVQRVPEAITVRNPHLPKSLDPVLAKALAKDPANRYQTARELRLAVEAAAGTLARTPKAAIGEFVTSLFPQERDKALALLELGRRRHAELTTVRNGRGGTLVNQRTQAGEIVVSPADDLGPRTRTGFLDTTGLGGVRIGDEHGTETRTGWVAPVGMSPLDLGLPTRTVVEPTLLDPSMPGGGVSVTVYDASVPATGAGDSTWMMAADGRTATMDMGSRTLVRPQAGALSPALRAPGPPMGVYVLGGFALLSIAVIIAGLLQRDPNEVHVIEATRAPASPPIVAGAAPVATAASPSPSEPMISPHTPAGSPASRSPEPRRSASDAPGIKRVLPTRTDTPAASNKLGDLSKDIERLRRDWDGLDDTARLKRFSDLANRLRDAAPDEVTRSRVSREVSDDRLSNEVESDIKQLRKALSLVEKATPP